MMGLKILLAALVLQATLAPQPQTASMEGRVTGPSGEFLPKVSLTLVGPGASMQGPASAPAQRTESLTAISNADGTFSFNNLRPGTYRLTAVRNGFTFVEFGQKGPNGVGSLITMAPGQKMKDVVLTIAPKGAVTGRIVDRNGMPIVRAAVQALEFIYLGPQQARSLTSVQSVTTDDNGTYRLFGLNPGNYVIGASTNSATRISVSVRETIVSVSPLTGPIQGVAIRTPRNDGTYEEEIPVPSYYPGTTSVGEATAVVVHAGETLGGIDFATRSAPSHRIRGTMLDSNTQRPAQAPIQLLPRKSTGASPLNFWSSETGTYEISGVVPGEYLLNGVPLVMGNVDLENVVVNSSSAALSIEGKIKFEGDTSGASLLANSFAFVGTTYSTSTPVLVQPDGSFTAFIAPGDYLILMGVNPARTQYLKSVRLGNQDGLDMLHILSQPESPMEIVIGSSKGSVDARIVDSHHEPVLNATVVLIPNVPRRQRTDAYLTATADSSGKFHFNAMPGDYKVFAWEDVETGAWLDPEFMLKYEGRGQPVTVREGSQDTIDVSVIPYVP